MMTFLSPVWLISHQPLGLSCQVHLTVNEPDARPSPTCGRIESSGGLELLAWEQAPPSLVRLWSLWDTSPGKLPETSGVLVVTWPGSHCRISTQSLGFPCLFGSLFSMKDSLSSTADLVCLTIPVEPMI